MDPTGKTYHVCPFALVPSKPQQNNYLLCYSEDDSTVMSFRLSRLRSVFFMDKQSSISDEDLTKLKLMKEKGPQFSFEKAENICVRFTDEGIDKFNRIYFNRPEIDRIESEEKHIYWFFWPKWAALEYFKRFGKDAVILHPESMRRELHDWYEDAQTAYAHSHGSD